VNEANNTHPQPRYKNRLGFWTLATLLMALLIFGIAAIVLWLPGSWTEKSAATFAIVTIYGLAIGFLSRGNAFSAMPELLDDLTSHNIVSYFIANLRFEAVVAELMAMGLSRRSLVSMPIWLALCPLALAFMVAHILVIAPLAYIPMAVASTVASDIVHSPNDAFLISTNIMQKAETGRVRIKDLVGEDQVALKALLVGIPALAVSVLSGIAALFTG
jgi:hypothetical protein